MDTAEPSFAGCSEAAIIASRLVIRGKFALRREAIAVLLVVFVMSLTWLAKSGMGHGPSTTNQRVSSPIRMEEPSTRQIGEIERAYSRIIDIHDHPKAFALAAVNSDFDIPNRSLTDLISAHLFRSPPHFD